MWDIIDAVRGIFQNEGCERDTGAENDSRVNGIGKCSGARASAIAILAAIFAAMLPAIAAAREPAPRWASAAALASPSPASSPSPAAAAAASAAIAPGWAPQPGTAAFKVEHAAAEVSPTANPSPAACCGAAPAPVRYSSPAALSDGERDYYHTRDGSYLDPGNWAVMVFKSRHDLAVYYKGRMFKAYHAVFGRSREHGTKLYEGDRRTPEGVYLISGKHPSARWHWFLTLDYPNAIDRLRYAALSTDDVDPPARDGRAIREGGSIGIHGTDVPLLNSGDVNWTTGCISLDNRDIAELHRLLPIGTVVIINP
jgi:hypothetical protein